MQIQCPGIPLFITFISMKLIAAFCLLILTSCHPSVKKDASATPTPPLSAQDTKKAVATVPGTGDQHKSIIHKTHLKDTLTLSGNFMLFLQPNTERFKELNA